MVNGQSGRFSGKAPISALKVFMTAVIVIGLIVLAIYLLNMSGVIEEMPVTTY
jgi:hypothetical protein